MSDSAKSMHAADMYAPIIGMDKISLNHVQLKEIINKKKLSSRRGRTVEYFPSGSSHGYVMENGDSFWKLTISETGKDAKFIKLQFGFNYGVKFGILDLSPRNSYGENFHNFSDLEFQNYLLFLREYLAKEYGIVVEFTNSHYKEMEINLTFPVRDMYERYRRPIVSIMSNVPRYDNLGRFGDTDNCAYITDNTACTGGKSLGIKIYNKTKKMHDNHESLPVGVEPGVDYMRIEFSLLKKEKIQKLFGCSEVGSITQEEIERVFRQLFDSYLRRAIEIWHETSSRILRVKVQKAYKARLENGGRWIAALFAELSYDELSGQYPILLSGEQLEDYIRKLPISNNNMSRTLKGYRKMKKGVFEMDGITKIEEIIKAVESAYVSSK